jgi:hypothetical protein
MPACPGVSAVASSRSKLKPPRLAGGSACAFLGAHRGFAAIRVSCGPAWSAMLKPTAAAQVTERRDHSFWNEPNE